jgi:hypothetical protein
VAGLHGFRSELQHRNQQQAPKPAQLHRHKGARIDHVGPIKLHVDNSAAVVFTQGQTRRLKMRRIDAHQPWVA